MSAEYIILLLNGPLTVWNTKHHTLKYYCILTWLCQCQLILKFTFKVSLLVQSSCSHLNFVHSLCICYLGAPATWASFNVLISKFLCLNHTSLPWSNTSRTSLNVFHDLKKIHVYYIVWIQVHEHFQDNQRNGWMQELHLMWGFTTFPYVSVSVVYLQLMVPSICSSKMAVHLSKYLSIV